MRAAGHIDEAFVYFGMALDHCPDAFGPNWGQAVTLSELGRDNKAMEILQFLVGRYPARAQPYFRLAALQSKNGLPEKARQTLEAGARNIPSKSKEFQEALK